MIRKISLQSGKEIQFSLFITGKPEAILKCTVKLLLTIVQKLTLLWGVDAVAYWGGVGGANILGCQVEAMAKLFPPTLSCHPPIATPLQETLASF